MSLPRLGELRDRIGELRVLRTVAEDPDQLRRIEEMMSEAERLEAAFEDEAREQVSGCRPVPASELTTEPHVCGPSGVIVVGRNRGHCVHCRLALTGTRLSAAMRRSPTEGQRPRVARQAIQRPLPLATGRRR